MKIYKLKDFARWAKKLRLSDDKLIEVVMEMNRGSTGDSLGAYVFKKRVGISGSGKRGGARCIIAYKKGDLTFFMHGYTKNKKHDLSKEEEEFLRIFAKKLMSLSNEEIEKELSKKELVLVEGDCNEN